VFADFPFASTAFAVQSATAQVIDVTVSESVTASELASAAANFVASILEGGNGSDSVLVAASVFNAAINEATTASEVISALVAFASTISEGATTSDSFSVAPSTFNALASERGLMQDAAFGVGAFLVSINEGAVADDEVVRRLLWEIINDAQTANWQVVKTEG